MIYYNVASFIIRQLGFTYSTLLTSCVTFGVLLNFPCLKLICKMGLVITAYLIG